MSLHTLILITILIAGYGQSEGKKKIELEYKNEANAYIAANIAKIQHDQKCSITAQQDFAVLETGICNSLKISHIERGALEDSFEECLSALKAFGKKICGERFTCDEKSKKCVCPDNTLFTGKKCVFKRGVRCISANNLECETGYYCAYSVKDSSIRNCTQAYLRLDANQCISNPDGKPEGEHGECCLCHSRSQGTKFNHNFLITFTILAKFWIFSVVFY